MNMALENRGAALVEQLGGFWQAGGGMCRCPAHKDNSPSLSVRVGERALLFKCFAGCDTRDVLRALARLDHPALNIISPQARYERSAYNPHWLRQRALDVWDGSVPLGGTSAEQYLQRRALSVDSLALRFNARTPLGQGKRATFRPALIAALHEAGSFVAVQRTFLDRHEPRRARDLTNPRWMLGRPYQGAVMLAPAGDILGLAEGVETAYSAMILLNIPVWATLGNERLARIALPDAVARLILLPDNDEGGRLGAARAEMAYAAPGRLVETIWPPACLNDWNDVLRREGRGRDSHGAKWPEGSGRAPGEQL